MKDIQGWGDIRIYITPVIGMKGQTDPVTNPPKLDENKLRQTSITDFIKSIPPTTSSNTAGKARDNLNTFTATSEKKGRQKHHKNCYKPNCKYCPYLDKSGSITCHFNGQTYFCKENVTCQSSNLIYGIGCKRCGKHYVGETKRPIHMRLSEHLRGIRNCQQNKETSQGPQPVALHFSAPDHRGTQDLKIQILDFVHFHPDSKKSEEIRVRVEKKWIHPLRCPAPLGMNILD
jgi:tripartite motif-containing protein 2/3